MNFNEIFQKLKKNFPNISIFTLSDLKVLDNSILIPDYDLYNIAKFLKNEMSFEFLVFITAVDWAGSVNLAGYTTYKQGQPTKAQFAVHGKTWSFENKFELIYHLCCFSKGGRDLNDTRIYLRTRIPRDNPKISSLVPLYPTADWQEREIYDLFGVVFVGHPNLKRILLWDDFPKDSHPLRKDYIHQKDRYD